MTGKNKTIIEQVEEIKMKERFNMPLDEEEKQFKKMYNQFMK